MNKFILTIFFTIVAYFCFGQIRYENFENGVPSYFLANNTNALSIVSTHQKAGANSLLWNTQNNDKLTISNLQIPASEINNYSANSAQFWIYNPNALQDTLLFKFYDSANVLKREGKIILNFNGWRDYHRSYRYDYNNGTEIAPFILNKIEITYKTFQNNSSVNAIALDEMMFAGNADVRNPGPHFLADIAHFNLTSNYTQAIYAYQNQADIAVSPATAEEIAAIENLKTIYYRTAGAANATQIAAAKAYVNYLNISTNANGSFAGKGIYQIYALDTLLKISDYVAYLSRAYVKNNDVDALNKLNVFVPYLLEQGLAEGGRVVTPYNNYSSSRSFPIGFLEALPLLTSATVKANVIKMLKWSNEFNCIYNANPVPGLEMDFMYLKSVFILELALLGDDYDTISRDLKSFRRYLEQFTNISQGARDGIKIDGSGFHHQAQYINYQYAYNSWISRAHELKGTPFKISTVAYNQMKLALKTLFLHTSKGTLIPHSASGRSPFIATVAVKAADLEKFIAIGGDLQNQTFDADMAAFYNDVFKSSKYAVTQKSWDGYHQFNYAQTGIYRKNNWVAVAKGLTDKMFGAEIYSGQNRYGRYQGYGALEILYDGNLASSGYITAGEGWDWNMMPGTTSVLLSYNNLKPIPSGTATEFQADTYAGALANGNYGIFGLNFIQNPGTKYTGQQLKFKQSVFTFDSLMVCLATDITAQNTSDNVISTLFQNVKSNNTLGIYVNNTLFTGDVNQQINLANQSCSIINTQGTGYYIPKGNQTLNIFRGNQTTPLQSSDNVANTATAYASKAWLNHGLNTNKSNYSYVVIPAVTLAKMQNITQKLDNNQLFTIVKQTDSLHIVKSNADSVIAVNAFYSNATINTEDIVGISDRALFFVKKVNKQLEIKIASPDLNAVAHSASTWIATVKPITVTIKGNWKILDNVNNATTAQNDGTYSVTFNLKDGFSQTILLEESDAEESLGTWVNPLNNWFYNLGDISAIVGFGNPPTYLQGSATVSGSYSHSISTPTSQGFLPKPINASSRVMIVNNTTTLNNGSFILQPDSALKMSASNTSGINKFSVFNLTNSTSVAKASFNISFSTNATNGEIIWALGNKETAGNLFNNASSVYRVNTEVFTAFLWEITNGEINFKYRQSANSNGGNYTTISNTRFAKGKKYVLEVFANNSLYSQNYIKNGQNYSLPSLAFNIWVKEVNAKGQSQLLQLNNESNFTASGELVANSTLNSFLFQGGKSTLPLDNALEITLSNINVNYADTTIDVLSIKPPIIKTDNEPVFKEKLSLYPNPVSTILTITTDKIVTSDVLIYDFLGVQVFSIKKENIEVSKVNKIDLSALKSGIYFLKVNHSTHKIIKL